MATVFNPDFEDEDKQKQLAGEGGTVGGFGGQAPAAPSAAPKGSGSFVNLSNYLRANEGTSAGMANKIDEHVGAEAKKGQDSLASTMSAFQGQVDKGTVRADQGLLKQAQSFTLDDHDIDRVTKDYNRQYGGPDMNAFQNQAQASKDALNRAYGMSQQAGSFEGNQALLGQVYGGPRYTRGLSSLDSALVTRDAGAQAKLTDTKARFSGLQGLYDKSAKDAAAAIQAGQDQSAAAKAQYAEAIKQGIGAFDKSLDPRVKAENDRRLQEFLAERNEFLNDPDYRPGGVSKYSYVKYGGDVGKGQVISADEAARLAALSNLIGEKPVVSREAKRDLLTFDEDGYNTARSEWEASRPAPKVAAAARPPVQPTRRAQPTTRTRQFSTDHNHYDPNEESIY